jgi:DNA-binding XRE family transcriptional regulator
LIVGYLPVASDWADLFLSVGFDVRDEVGVVGEPRIEEVGVGRYTYLFFEFGDNVTGKIVLCLLVCSVFASLFVEAEGEQIGRFLVGVEGVNKV